MCGIAGAVWTPGAEPVSGEALWRMTTAIAHRGPDGDGYYRREFDAGGGAALGHRRLAIIDVDGGRQPLSNENESVWVVFNGEIYNFASLRTSLQSRGHVFRTATDTEVLVHLYEDYGEDMVRHLRGMFAFAIWDERKRKLLLARDRFGQKPLVYMQQRGRVLFGSEIKALLQIDGVAREIDHDALHDYLLLTYVPHPRTIFRGINKLPPAHYAVFQDGAMTIRRYWELDYFARSGDSERACQEQIREKLSEATRLQLRSDVPLGAFLSGGVDSTVIVGLMNRLSSTAVKTFNISFDDPERDESSYAREAAQFHRTEHHCLEVGPDAIELLPRLVWHYDEPFADSSAIPCFYLSKFTKSHVSVALNGDAGDELFLGYGLFDKMRLTERLDRLPASARWALSRVAAGLSRLGGNGAIPRKLGTFSHVLQLGPEDRYRALIDVFTDAQVDSVAAADFKSRLTAQAHAGIVSETFARTLDLDVVSRVMFVNLAGFLPGDLLTKIDIASMAYGLECRSPMLDHEFAEAACRIPMPIKMRGGARKRFFKEAFADLLPPRISARPKMGFEIPMAAWLRGPLHDHMRGALLSATSLERGYFRPEAVRTLIEEHRRGVDHSSRLWVLLVLEQWHQQYMDRNSSSSPAEPCYSRIGCV